jgi:hypothetical protein
LASCNAGVALAQDPELTVSVGVRAWFTEWSTFTYFVENINGIPTSRALAQSPANDELVLMPSVSVRYGKYSGSLSVFPSTSYTFLGVDAAGNGFVDGAKREEIDLNFGYAVTAGLTPTLGFKRVTQSGSAGRYELFGPVVGVSAYAPLGGLLALYGSLGLGRMETTSGSRQTDGQPIDFDAHYRLAEVGLAYTSSAAGLERWTFTGGYRVQVFDSGDAFQALDGRDTTQGFTLGAVATF